MQLQKSRANGALTRRMRVELVRWAAIAIIAILISVLIIIWFHLSFAYRLVSVFGLLFYLLTVLLSGFWLFGIKRSISAYDGSSMDSNPPKSATLVLLMIPRQQRENLVGDLEEEFYEIVLPKFGLIAAQQWYRWQVFWSVCAFVAETIKGVVLFWRTSR
jgi:hypothetical protein